VTKRLVKIAATVVVLLTLVAGLAFVRTYLLDSATRAIKNENGPDGAAAIRSLTPLAELGDGKAQFLLGDIYAGGFGVREDDRKAIYWFRRAALSAEAGADPAAPAELAKAKDFAEGTNVEKADLVESAKWLRLAAAGGSKEAAAILRHGGVASRP
jgi:TPR repeat protein